jgi:hypothetical protein
VSNLTRFIGAVKLVAKAKAPTIMVVSGVASMGASVVVASKKTLQVEPLLEPVVADLEKIQKGIDLELDGYTSKMAAQDRGKVYGRTAIILTKHYIVPGVLFFGGAALVFGGHHILLKRNATLAVAFTGVKEAFDAYRARVREEFGDAADQGMLHGHRQIEIIEEDGTVRTVNTRDWDAEHSDPYNRVFDSSSSQWYDDLGVNKMFVQNQMRMAQILLGQRGYLYLSEVYEALGFPETDVSRVVGWKEKRNPDGSKDIPIVDFGLDRPMPDDWKYNRKNEIYLDFNCQGLIIGGKVQKALEKA